jgi:hypothetical protein
MESSANTPTRRDPLGIQLPPASQPENCKLHPADDQGVADGGVNVTPRGVARMKEVITMVKETGKYPSSTALDASERSLATWLRRRRREAESGTLAAAFQTGLDVLPNWQNTPKSTADNQRWIDRLAALAQFRAAGHDWPRHKGANSLEEHQLGIWIHTQRFKLRRGELDPPRIEALDRAVPGWRSGRRRGPKPLQE